MVTSPHVTSGGETVALVRRSGEHFIPFRKTDVISMCADELPPAERESFLAFARMLTSLLHHRFHARIEALKDAYHPFNPEADTRTVTR